MKNSQIWFGFFIALLAVVPGGVAAQTRMPAVTFSDDLPSRQELDLLFAMQQNKMFISIPHKYSADTDTAKLTIMKRIRYSNFYPISTFMNPDLTYPNRTIFLFDSYKKMEEGSQNRNFKPKPSAHPMPTYHQWNPIVPQSRQVLDYFLALGSSLYVTAQQRER